MKNENTIAILLDTLFSQLDSKFHQDIMIFGSSAVFLHGVTLDREINDLDVFVSMDTFDVLKEYFTIKSKDATEGGEILYLKVTENIEIYRSFPGVEFNDVYQSSKILQDSRSFRVGSLLDLRKWKMQQGRNKDREDIHAIDSRIRECQAKLDGTSAPF